MLLIDNDGVSLRNTRYGDVYRSVSGCLQESEWVFVEPAWQMIERLASHGRTQFHVLELGFGLGFNLSVFLDRWLKRAKPSWRCYVQSIELHPLGLDQYRRAWAAVAGPPATELVERWLHCFDADGAYALPGIHRYALHSNFWFDFFVADVSMALKRLHTSFDIVFLDGFSEAANPSMWRSEVFRDLRRHLYEGALLLSYASAKSLRDRLSALEFDVSREPGFPPKRFRLEARYRPYRRIKPFCPKPAVEDLMIIGAGLAGQCMALAARARGIQGVLIDAKLQQDCDSQAHLPAFLEHLHCSPDDNEMARLSRAALLSSYRLGSAQGSQGLSPLVSCRLQLLYRSEARAEWAKRLNALLAHSEASFNPWPALFQVLDEYRLCLPRSRAMALPNQLAFPQRQAFVARLDLHDGRWQAFDESGQLIASAATMVLTSPQALVKLGFNHAMPLQRKPGVSLLIDISSVDPLHPVWQIKSILADQQHVLRLAAPDRLLVGSLYGEPNDIEARSSLLDALQALLAMDASLFDVLSNAPSVLWRGVRFNAPDHLPMIGAIADRHQVGEQWERLRKNARLPMPRLEQAYTLTALGARGALWAPFGAEILLDMMQSIPCPLESDLLAAIDPARGLIRAMRRGEPLSGTIGHL
jgi:tRNA 5-methylaminomethyl-2-thiouridine biosynthesis bifunctional protein